MIDSVQGYLNPCIYNDNNECGVYYFRLIDVYMRVCVPIHVPVIRNLIDSTIFNIEIHAFSSFILAVGMGKKAKLLQLDVAK